MHFKGNQNPHRPMTNFKELKSHIIHNPEPDLEIEVTPSFQHRYQPDALKIDHPSVKMNRNIQHKDKLSSRRLNLKEYIHLNSIEKKAKSKSFSRKHDNSKISSVNSVQLSKHDESKPDLDMNEHSKEMNRITHDVLREQVEKKIEEGIKQLQDLSMFMKTHYSEKASLKESQLFLFDVLKGIDNTGSHLKEVGEKVEKYQGEQHRPNYQYYWNKNSRVLHSPAKMKNAYEFTISTFQTLLRPANQPPHT